MRTDETPTEAKPWWRRRSWADFGVSRGRPLPTSVLGYLAICAAAAMVPLAMIVGLVPPRPTGSMLPFAPVVAGAFAAASAGLTFARPRHGFVAALLGFVTAVALGLEVPEAHFFNDNRYAYVVICGLILEIALMLFFAVTRIPRFGGRADPAVREPGAWVELELLWDDAEPKPGP